MNETRLDTRPWRSLTNRQRRDRKLAARVGDEERRRARERQLAYAREQVRRGHEARLREEALYASRYNDTYGPTDWTTS